MTSAVTVGPITLEELRAKKRAMPACRRRGAVAPVDLGEDTRRAQSGQPRARRPELGELDVQRLAPGERPRPWTMRRGGCTGTLLARERGDVEDHPGALRMVLNVS